MTLRQKQPPRGSGVKSFCVTFLLLAFGIWHSLRQESVVSKESNNKSNKSNLDTNHTAFSESKVEVQGGGSTGENLSKLSSSPVKTAITKTSTTATMTKTTTNPLKVLHKDVCIVGDKGVGRTFNKMIALGNAMAYAQQLERQAQQQEDAAVMVKSVVRVHKRWMSLYREWFQDKHETAGDGNNDDETQWLVQPIDSNSTRCHRKDQAGVHFHGKLLLSNPTVPYGKRYLPSLRLLLPHLKPSLIDAARAALEQHRQQYLRTKYSNMTTAEAETTKVPVVTVHLRWLEGSCLEWAGKMSSVCPLPAYFENWKFTCGYTQQFCRHHYLTRVVAHVNNTHSRNNNSTIRTDDVALVSMGDFQNKKAERTFDMRSNHPFPVQAVMMMLSDYHFGNPMSSIDLVVAHWPNRRYTQFPEPCYQSIWELQQQYQQKQEQNRQRLAVAITPP